MQQLVAVAVARGGCRELVGEGIEDLASRRVAPRSVPRGELGEDREAPGGMQVRQQGQKTARLELREPLEAPLDAFGQFARRLAREGQAEHFVTTDDAVGDQPDDAPRHRLGLSASRSGHDERRGQRRFDDGGLLGRGRKLTQRRGDRRCGECRAHEALTADTVWMRQSPYENSSRQWTS
ncbi:MAG: hypothetical protein K0S70_4912 [Microbacterium sp.]|nr:hypothetical protein [Microbacterium sp.]